MLAHTPSSPTGTHPDQTADVLDRVDSHGWSPSGHSGHSIPPVLSNAGDSVFSSHLHNVVEKNDNNKRTTTSGRIVLSFLGANFEGFLTNEGPPTITARLYHLYLPTLVVLQVRRPVRE